MLLRKALILSLLSLASAQRNFLPDLSATTTFPTSNQSSTFFNLPPAKSRQQDVLQDVSDSSSSFALDLFVRFTDIVSAERRDFIVSPFSIWSLLLPLVEGAGGNTLSQMRSVLRLSEDQRSLGLSYRTIKDYLRLDTPYVKISSLQTMFTDKNQPVNHDYQKTIESEFDPNIFYPIDLQDPNKAANIINAEVRTATNNLISHAILPQDLKDAKMLLLTSLFFKGLWKTPFNESMTRREPFYDEVGQQIGNVDMMVQIGRFNYTGMNELEGHVLELPYGMDDRVTMLLILPKRGVSLPQVARNLQKIGIARIFERLVSDAVGFEDEEVEVFVPKFISSSDFVLNRLLLEMGMIELFGQNANLSKIDSGLYLQRMLHSTKIINDEKGTSAAGVTIAVLTNKATPPKFLLNRPFMYLIVEKQTNLILFYGQLMNPNNVNVPT